LSRFGAHARPAAAALSEALADNDPEVRKSARYALSEANLDPLQAARKHFKSEDVRVRVNVASGVLANIARDHPEAIGILAEALKEEDGEVRRQAAFSLGQSYHAPGTTVAVLAQTFRHRDARVREQAALLLGRLGEKGEQAVPGLVAAFQDEEPRVRREV